MGVMGHRGPKKNKYFGPVFWALVFYFKQSDVRGSNWMLHFECTCHLFIQCLWSSKLNCSVYNNAILDQDIET